MSFAVSASALPWDAHQLQSARCLPWSNRYVLAVAKRGGEQVNMQGGGLLATAALPRSRTACTGKQRIRITAGCTGQSLKLFSQGGTARPAFSKLHCLCASLLVSQRYSINEHHTCTLLWQVSTGPLPLALSDMAAHIMRNTISCTNINEKTNKTMLYMYY